MDIDPLTIADPGETSDLASPKRKRRWLNPAVAITVALLSTFMGICKVKDDNIVQGMQAAQADRLDQWQFYQARNIREEVAKAALVQLRLQRDMAPKAMQPKYEEQVAAYGKLVADQHTKKDELKALADKDQATYDALNFRDDQFDLSDALIAIAISLLAIASLTQMPWLFALALVPSAFGTLMGLAGLLGWPIHPDVLTAMLS
jgi:ribosomal protein S13